MRVISKQIDNSSDTFSASTISQQMQRALLCARSNAPYLITLNNSSRVALSYQIILDFFNMSFYICIGAYSAFCSMFYFYSIIVTFLLEFEDCCE